MALFVLILVLLEDAPVVEDAGTVLTGVAMAGPVGGEGLGLRPILLLACSALPWIIMFLMILGWCHYVFELRICPLCEYRLVPSSSNLVKTCWYAFRIFTSKKASIGSPSKLTSSCSFFILI